MSYSNTYSTEALQGLSADTRAQERERYRKATQACHDKCKQSPIASTCTQGGMEAYARSCDWDTGIPNECGCRQTRVTKTEGPPIRVASAGAGYGGIIPRSNTLSGLSATAKLPGRMAANAWCAKRMSCLNGRKPIATDVKHTWEMTTDDCSCVPESASFGTGIRQSGNALVPRHFVMPRFSAMSRRRTGMGDVSSYDVTAIDGLGESFLESLGSLANLAIVGLAIYGGFCLAKKL